MAANSLLVPTMVQLIPSHVGLSPCDRDRVQLPSHGLQLCMSWSWGHLQSRPVSHPPPYSPDTLTNFLLAGSGTPLWLNPLPVANNDSSNNKTVAYSELPCTRHRAETDQLTPSSVKSIFLTDSKNTDLCTYYGLHSFVSTRVGR